MSPIFRAYTNILALALTKLEPAEEISPKIQIDFVRDPMFLQSYAVLDIISKQIEGAYLFSSQIDCAKGSIQEEYHNSVQP